MGADLDGNLVRGRGTKFGARDLAVRAVGPRTATLVSCPDLVDNRDRFALFASLFLQIEVTQHSPHGLIADVSPLVHL